MSRRSTDDAVASRRGIQSIGIGIAVLRALTMVSGPQHLREIAARSSMPANKAFKYLASFVDCGLVKQDPLTQRYDLGPFAIELGLAALGRIDELEIAATALQRVTRLTGHDAHMSIWGHGGPTVVRWMPGSEQISIKVREGSVLPLLTTATGRIWARHLPPGVTEPLVEAELAALARSTGRSRQLLREEYGERIAALALGGIAASAGERRLGIDALSGPIFGPDGMAFAVTLIGSHRDFDLALDGAAATMLLEALRDATQQLGGRVPGAAEIASTTIVATPARKPAARKAKP